MDVARKPIDINELEKFLLGTGKIIYDSTRKTCKGFLRTIHMCKLVAYLGQEFPTFFCVIAHFYMGNIFTTHPYSKYSKAYGCTSKTQRLTSDLSADFSLTFQCGEVWLLTFND